MEWRATPIWQRDDIGYDTFKRLERRDYGGRAKAKCYANLSVAEDETRET